MNSYKNFDVEYRNSKGTELLPGQLLSMFKNIFEKGLYSSEELKTTDPLNQNPE